MPENQKSVENYFKVFNKAEYRYRWDKLKEYALINESIPESLRSELLDSYTFLQNELGTSFLLAQRDFKREKRHPILSIMDNMAAWRLSDFVRFTQRLKHLKADSHSNYSYLLQKLKSTQACRQEGIPFTDIADSYIKAGCKVHFLKESPPLKCADIEILNPTTNEKLYIELTKLGESDNRKSSFDNYQDLIHLLNSTAPILPCSCIQIEFINEQEMPFVLQTIKELKDKALNENSIVTHVDGKIDIAIAHQDKCSLLKEWCAKNGNRREWVTGLPLNFDETPRILKNNIIKREAKQISSESMGLIYIPLTALYFSVVNLDDAIALFEKEINRYENLLGVVLYSYIGDTTKDISIEENKHYYSRKTIGKGSYRDLFFVYNHSFKRSITEDMVQKIYTSFENLDVTFL